MEYILTLHDEDSYNSISFKIGWFRWDAVGYWNTITRIGTHRIKVPVKGRARWLRRNGPMLEKLGFHLERETVDATWTKDAGGSCS